jgi:hypothetical protein
MNKTLLIAAIGLASFTFASCADSTSSIDGHAQSQHREHTDDMNTHVPSETADGHHHSEAAPEEGNTETTGNATDTTHHANDTASTGARGPLEPKK